MPMHGPLRIHSSIFRQLSTGCEGSIGIKPETRSACLFQILADLPLLFGRDGSAQGSVGEPAMSSESIRSIPIRST